MVEKVTSVTFIGIEAIGISIEVLISSGLPSFKIVGLPDKAVAESKERVRGALIAMGQAFPAKKITVNLAPADIPKEGSHFDLAIALCLMQALGTIPRDILDDYVIMGELSLDARINSSSGVLPAAIYANSCDLGLICPSANGSEASFSGLKNIIAVGSIFELLGHIIDGKSITQPKPITKEEDYDQDSSNMSFRQIKGQESIKRALEIAAAGNHNMLMIGPPGAGKSLLAKSFTSLLPDLTPNEAIELAVIRSISKKFSSSFSLRRPFRDPHHTASVVSIIGGGTKAQPGEVSLAHGGVLFLDELPEFSAQALETLRQPLENGEVVISRANNHITYPSKFQLIAAMNPCRCGYFGIASKECPKAPKCAQSYQEKLSGPLLDRIDIHVFVDEVSASSLLSDNESPKDEILRIKERVTKARQIQFDRFKDFNKNLNQNSRNIKKSQFVTQDIITNAQANPKMIEELFMLNQDARDYLAKAADKIGISARGLHRVIKLARTICDIDQVEVISQESLSEALSYRQHLMINTFNRI